jgi:integrase
MVLLTGPRPGEVAGAAISELADIESDGGRARLEISAHRMKARRPHVTPLAPTALSIIRKRLSATMLGRTHVFQSHFEGRGPIARHSLSQGLRRIVEGLRPGAQDAEPVARLKADPPTARYP